MQFCTICGKPLQPGFACDCQGGQQYQQTFEQQPQFQPPPQQFEQQPQFQQPPPQYPQQNQYPQYPQQQYPQYPQQNQYQQYPPNPYQAVGKPPGQTLIRVIRILCTIVGTIALGASAEILEFFDLLPSDLQMYIGFSLLLTLSWITAGIIGIVLAAKKDKAKVIIGFGAAVIALRVIDLIWALAAYSEILEGSDWFIAIAGLTLPILLIVGGVKRNNAPY